MTAGNEEVLAYEEDQSVDEQIALFRLRDPYTSVGHILW
jgi:hypothetical protein